MAEWIAHRTGIALVAGSEPMALFFSNLPRVWHISILAPNNKIRWL